MPSILAGEGKLTTVYIRRSCLPSRLVLSIFRLSCGRFDFGRLLMADSSPVNAHLYAIVAGELSGDTLGAGLMRAIKRLDPEAEFIGIGGPKMCALGMNSLFDINILSVMGIFEVLSHLLPILKVRRRLIAELLKARPTVMIGIDSPDFNLTVEKKLRSAGIKTVHYVSPSVWAWREGRMKKIRAACDEVLALLPFEKEYYDRVGMPCTYVGHSLAGSIPLKVSQAAARDRLSLSKNCVGHLGSKVLVILPGSRKGIISTMMPVYAEAAALMKSKIPDLTFLSVAPDREKALLIKDLWLQNAPHLSLTVFVGPATDVIAAGDVCMLTSGTVAFETMLLKRPMVVAYRMSRMTAAIASHLVKTKFISLPNLIAGKELVKELIQDECTPLSLSEECLRLLGSENVLLKSEFTALHKKIRTDSDTLAAKAVLRVIKGLPPEKGVVNSAYRDASDGDKASAETNKDAEHEDNFSKAVAALRSVGNDRIRTADKVQEDPDHSGSFVVINKENDAGGIAATSFRSQYADGSADRKIKGDNGIAVVERLMRRNGSDSAEQKLRYRGKV